MAICRFFATALLCEGSPAGELCHSLFLPGHGKAVSNLTATFPGLFWAPPPNQKSSLTRMRSKVVLPFQRSVLDAWTPLGRVLDRPGGPVRLEPHHGRGPLLLRLHPGLVHPLHEEVSGLREAKGINPT